MYYDSVQAMTKVKLWTQLVHQNQYAAIKYWRRPQAVEEINNRIVALTRTAI